MMSLAELQRSGLSGDAKKIKRRLPRCKRNEQIKAILRDTEDCVVRVSKSGRYFVVPSMAYQKYLALGKITSTSVRIGVVAKGFEITGQDEVSKALLFRQTEISTWKIRDQMGRFHEVHPMLWLLYQRQGLIVQVSNTLADVAPNILMVAVNQQFSPFEFRTARDQRKIEPGISSSWNAMFWRVWMYREQGGRMTLTAYEEAVRQEFDELERAALRQKPEIVERRFSGIPVMERLAA